MFFETFYLIDLFFVLFLQREPKSSVAVEKDKELKEVGELDDKTFKLCKEKMRTEKKSLQMLHQPDQDASEQAQMQATKKCLLKIGDHIEKTINSEYKHDHDLVDVWRRYVL